MWSCTGPNEVTERQQVLSYACSSAVSRAHPWGAGVRRGRARRCAVEDVQREGVSDRGITSLIRVDSVARQLRQHGPAWIHRVLYDVLEIDHGIKARLRRPETFVVGS